MVPFLDSPAFVAYALVYAVAGFGSLLAVRRAQTVDDPATRRGLIGLLVGSGGWAVFELGYLIAPTAALSYALYVGSLIVGLTTIGAWLYFCSAYTGRTFHRNATYRRAAVAVYLAVVAVKLTNPIHGFYFTVEFVTTPFPHLSIRHGAFHWIVTGLSYSLAAVGFFMLLEVFLDADYDTRPLGALVAVTGLPVVFDILGFTTSALLDINYEPLGVVVFAVGILYVYEERFLAVQLTRDVTDPVVYLDNDDRIREFNERARELFPALSGSTGSKLDRVLPQVTDSDDVAESIIERENGENTEYYLASDTTFSLGSTDIGRLIVFTDVTETERQRRELARHNDQLEGFAAAIRHELLNTLQITSARVSLAGEALEEGNVNEANDSLNTAKLTTDRMTAIVDDLADLARYGQSTREMGSVSFRPAVESAFEAAGDVDLDLDLTVEGEGTVRANGPRLRELLENAFRFAIHNGASSVTVSLLDDGFAISDDGDPPRDGDTSDYFAYGEAVPDSKAGMTLPNLRMLCEAQGWEAEIDESYRDGVRVVVSGVRVDPPSVENDGG